MTKSVAKFFFIVNLFFLSGLFFSVSALANTPGETETSHYLEQLLNSNPEHLLELKNPAVLAFYQEREYKPLWSDTKGRLNRAYDLLYAIINAGNEGLKPSDYYLEGIKKYWDSTATEDAIYLDLLLTAALCRYSGHVYSGRFDSHEMDANWHIQNTTLDMRRLLADTANKESIAKLLKELHPRLNGYHLLKKALQHFRQLERQGGWQKLEAGPILKPGVQNQQVRQLRQRLKISGDLAECTRCDDIDIFGHELVQAVKRFQARHGLEADGRVGKQTRRALNITVSEKIRQISINMERWRWMPRKLSKRHLMVNMTGFELYIMKHESVVLSMPVIIGKAYRSTPSFSGLISTMVYNPYWTVPTSIAVEDFLPRIINDPSLLTKKSIRVFRGWGENAREIDPQTVDWKKLNKDHFPYWLRQDPGPKNALGQMKFLFSNPYDIYLHGTPDKHLFDRLIRTFSSGCIRVKDPVRLAAYLLNDSSQQMEEDVLANIYLGTNQRVTLPVAVPIYLVYWTAWADENGSINFRHDIYGRDTRLKKMFDS